MYMISIRSLSDHGKSPMMFLYAFQPVENEFVPCVAHSDDIARLIALSDEQPGWADLPGRGRKGSRNFRMQNP